MAESIIQARRSSVAGKIPTTADLLPGEFGINSTDGKVYIEKSAGITTIIAVNPWNVGIGSTSFDMNFSNNGRVAIGSDLHISLLSVGDVSNFVTRRGSLSIKTIPVTSSVGEAALYLEEQTGTEGWYVTINVLGDMLFSNSGSATYSVEFIDATDDVLIRKGDIGILTTTATDALTVFGNGRITGVTTITGDCRVGVSTNEGVILTSANATKYRLIVDNSGNLSTVAT
jgi:hypothetical protein